MLTTVINDTGKTSTRQHIGKTTGQRRLKLVVEVLTKWSGQLRGSYSVSSWIGWKCGFVGRRDPKDHSENTCWHFTRVGEDHRMKSRYVRSVKFRMLSGGNIEQWSISCNLFVNSFSNRFRIGWFKGTGKRFFGFCDSKFDDWTLRRVNMTFIN